MKLVDLNNEQTLDQLEQLIIAFKKVAIQNNIDDKVQGEALLMMLFDLARHKGWTQDELDTLIKYILVSVEQ